MASPGSVQLQQSGNRIPPFPEELLSPAARAVRHTQEEQGLQAPPAPQQTTRFGEPFRAVAPPLPEKVSLPSADSHRALLVLGFQLGLVAVTAGLAGSSQAWRRGMLSLWLVLWFLFLLTNGPAVFGRLSKITGVK